ncbi:MAG: NAD(P)(+) transhydrogenase (Re/Si-specific) subunit beta [Gaiellaceae bacterium]
MTANQTTLAYLPTIIAFILALKFLSSPKHARLGNQLGAVGMALAIAVTIAQKGILNAHNTTGYILMGIGGLIGALIGWFGARLVKMTAMPQMVALFNGVGGGAVALIAIVEFHERTAGISGRLALDVSIALIISALIGSISFAGSMIAFGKLQGLVGDRPIVWPGQRIINILILAGGLGAGIVILAGHDFQLIWILLIEIGLALMFGVMFVLPIGGADMPVVIALLNAFTGLSASAAGFELHLDVLIVSGMLVGSSGTLLTLLMCRAMNRSLTNVIFGAFGQIQAGPAGASSEGLTVRATTAEDVAIMLAYAHQVVIVPGYGMAVAQAQQDVRQLAELLEKRGVRVEYAIHPVAGRMPGHMNVLLAEANVPYTQLKEMDEINTEFPNTDVSLVIGANDVVNPAARSDTSSPIYGMPILDVDKSKAVVVLKRSMNPGFAGIENHLFYEPETSMLFGDAKDSITKLIAAVKSL